MRTWTEPFDLPGQWKLAPERDPAPESGTESSEKVETEAAPEANAATADAPPPERTEEAPAAERSQESSGGAEESEFPPPWPAYGTLRFSPDEPMRLPLLGPGENPFNPEITPGQTLHGETLAREPVSLLGGHLAREEGYLLGHSERVISGGLLVVGAHIHELSDLKFDHARIRLTGLREFLWHPILQEAVGLGREDGLLGDVREKVVCVEGAELRFRLEWEGEQGQHTLKKERFGVIDVQLDEPLDFAEWESRWVVPLRDLVNFATRKPSLVHSVVALFERPAERPWWRPNEDRGPETIGVEFFKPRSGLIETRPRFDYSQVLFSLGELPDANDALERWLALHRRLRPTANFLFTALTSRMHLENRLLNLASAAEAYHRTEHNKVPLDEARHEELVAAMLARCANQGEKDVYKAALRYANDQSQRKRVCLLFRRAADAIPSVRDNHQTRVNELVDTRNHFVHQAEREDTVRQGRKLGLLLEVLVFVLQANLLLDVGLQKELVAAMLQRSYQGQSGFEALAAPISP